MRKWRRKLSIIIFRADTIPGKIFDVVLLVLIFASVLTVLLDTVESINRQYHGLLFGLEWFFTVAFTVEYLIRLYCARHTGRYALSFYGLIDLLAVLPSYFALFVIGASHLIVLRAIRLLRIFLVFKLGRFISQANFLLHALKKGFRKIIVFLGTVLTIVIIMGALMYLIEGPENGFVSIPKAMYWAIVTMTTVGYGDISPQTPLGQFFSSVIMLLGYGIIAVPTGILSAEMILAAGANPRFCPACGGQNLPPEARFCPYCGNPTANKPSQPVRGK